MLNNGKEKNGVFSRIRHYLIRRPATRTQLLAILRDAMERKILGPEIFFMIERVFQVAESQVRDIMVARSQMIVFNQTDSLEKILSVVIESAHSRYPVMADQAVCGLLLAKDLLPSAI